MSFFDSIDAVVLAFIFLIIILIAFLSGYLAGKKRGRLLGQNEAETLLPLIIRQKSFESGFCVVCGQNGKNTERNKLDFCREKITE